MPAASFFCFSFGFKPNSGAPSLPSDVLEVAETIYLGGRAGGLSGLEATAHVIQNRMNDPAFPSDAVSVVSMGGDLLPQGPLQTMPTSPGPAEKQFLDRAKDMASQLVHAPHRLSSRDPTGGGLYNNNVNSGSSANESGRNSPRVSERSDELSEDDDELSVPPASPRPVLPIRSRMPFFLREQNIAGVNKRPYVQGASDWTPSTGESSSVASPSSGSSVESMRSTSGTPVLTHAGDQPVRSATPVPLGPPPSSAPSPSSAFSASGSSSTSGSRLINRPARGARAASSAGAVQLGPADSDGYRDMVLPCGLYQDEVIALMYRDINPEDFEKLCKLDERVPKRNTAQRDLVNQLPRVPAKDCGVTECSVCLGSFQPQQSVVKLPCNHAFHHACISKWLTQCKNTCPLCSAPITAEASASTNGSGVSAVDTASSRSCMRAL